MKYLSLISIIVIMACGGGGSDSDNSDYDDPNFHTVMYRAEGAGITNASISFINSEGGRTRLRDVALPWQSERFTVEDWEWLHISVHSGTDENLSVKAILYVNGEVFATSVGHGPHCSASIGEHIEFD